MLNLIQARYNNQMASTGENRDLLCCLQNISSRFKPLQTISFFFSNSDSSSSYQESDFSLRVNISTSSYSNDTQFFGQFLHQLAVQRDKHNDLTSLLFHGVEWKMDHISNLKFILMGSSIEQIEFDKNTFGSSEVLSELSEAIGTNTCLKAISFSECQIGWAGATLLASVLSKNDNTVEELQIWEDSIGSKGAEELSKMIEVNHTIKLLTILDKNSVAAAPLISAILSRNRSLEMHVWGNSYKIVEFAPQPGTLKIYGLAHSSDLRRVAISLGWNTTVVTLDMTGVRLKMVWARDFRGVLESNRTLKDVKLSRTGLGNRSVVYIGAGLFKNKCLEKLSLDGNRFGSVGLEHLLCPLSRFSPLQNQPANDVLKSLTFGGERTKMRRGGVLAILRMLETNETINELVISGDKSLRVGDVIRIFASLERNVTLKRLSLKGCKAVEGDLVLQAIINVLQVNPWIEEIDLSNTPLQASGKAALIYEKLRLNASPVQEHVEPLANLPLSMPTCCKVFVCGQQYAGKNTLCDSIYYNMSGTRLPYMDKVRTLIEPIEQIVRNTSEIKITTIHENDAKISIWNLSCNHDYLGLLDQLFSGYQNLSFFLIVASLIRTSNNRDPKTPQEIEQELVMWIKSIGSCLTRSASSQPVTTLHVTVVLTHSDKISQQPETLRPIASVIQKLREDFKEYIEIYATVFTVDARSTANVSRLVHHLRKTAKTILQRAPMVYQLCNELINILREWRSRNSNKQVMKWSEFCELCQMKIAVLRIRSRLDNVEKVNRGRREAARSLHKMGEIIFFEEIGFLILDSEWFCRDVLGQITDSAKFFKGGAERKGEMQNNGFISRKEMEEILIKASRLRIGTGFILAANDLIDMMVKLELCYEQEPVGHPSSLLLVPSILDECNARSQSWEIFSSECVYVGRRLECDDTRHLCLPATFFPRLQVQLHNKLMQSVNQQGLSAYRLEKNLIYLIMNGIHVRIEIGVQPYYYIDVLACSVQNITETTRLFHQLIIPSILTLCSPKMILNESIIRPDCIKYLTPHRFRNTQHVSLQRLKETLLSLPADVMYDYQHAWNPVENVLNSGFDYARDLLSDDEFRQVVNRRYHDLHHLAVELAVPTLPHDSKEEEENETGKEGVEPSILGIAKGVETVLNRLRSIEQEIKDLKQEIQGLRYYEHRLLTELHKKVEYVVNYQTQLEERKVPYMFYLVQLDSTSERRLVTRLVPGMRSLRLHMLCEFRKEMHVVEDQLGCDLIQVDNQAVQSLLPFVNGFMKLLTLALKIGVHFVAGMGHMIPDLSREVARLLDPSINTLYASTAITATALGAARAFGRSRNRSEIGEDHVRSARQWIVDFLKSQGVITGTDIAQRFGLWRVRYRDDGNVAWICARHLNNNVSQIYNMPL